MSHRVPIVESRILPIDYRMASVELPCLTLPSLPAQPLGGHGRNRSRAMEEAKERSPQEEGCRSVLIPGDKGKGKEYSLRCGV